jgi:hypothetical protein
MHKRPDVTRAQLECCRVEGGDVALFSYESLYAAHGDRSKDDRRLAGDRSTREWRRHMVGDYLR